MIDLGVKVVAFLGAIVILVTVHELGHFWAARRLGIKVLRFSIGFGRPLLSWRRRNDDTEYVLSAIPLGGYVKMLDEREEDVDPRERHLAFNNQDLWKRSVVVAAGPIANFLFAIAAYWGLLTVGETGLRAEVGIVEPDSIAAEAGFAPGDTIQAVEGRETPLWSNFWLAVLSASLGGDDVRVLVRTADGVDDAVRMLPGEQVSALDPGSGLLVDLGLQRASPIIPPVLGKVVSEEPAAAAGLLPGDRVLSINGEAVASWMDLVLAVRAAPGEELAVEVDRDGVTNDIRVTPIAVDDRGESIGRIGAGPALPDSLFDDYRATIHWGPGGALAESVRRVGDLSVLTLRIVGRMLVGSASIDNLSSPIGIADAAGETAQVGIAPYIEFLALLSVSLGLLNLLPIPVLDGGHLLYFAVEGVRGRPLSEEAQAQGQRIGLALIIALMSLAFYADIARMLG
jgi:regulator of sigma E protease